MSEPKITTRVGDRCRHIKSGNTYTVEGFCMLEKEWRLAVLYRSHDTEELIARECKEFEDGRFEILQPFDPLQGNYESHEEITEK